MTQQDLAAKPVGFAQADHGLDGQLEIAEFLGPAQAVQHIHLDLVTLTLPFLLSVLEDDDLVASLALGLAAGVVGTVDQLAAGLAAQGRAHAHAGGDGKALGRNDEGAAGNGIQGTIGQQAVRRIVAVEQHREFVAPHAGNLRMLAQPAAQSAHDIHQHRVTGLMPEHIVEHLEAVQVDVAEGHPIQRFMLVQQCVEALLQAMAVQRAGQPVVLGLVDEVVFGLLERRDVGEADVVTGIGFLGLHPQPAMAAHLLQAPDEVGFLEVLQFLMDAFGQILREGVIEGGERVDVGTIQRGAVASQGQGIRTHARDPMRVDAGGRHVEQPHRHFVVALDAVFTIEGQQADGHGTVGGLVASQGRHGGFLAAQLARTLGRQVADDGGGGVHHGQQRGGLQVQPGQRRLGDAQQEEERVGSRHPVQQRGAQVPDRHHRDAAAEVDHHHADHGDDNGTAHQVQQRLEDVGRQQAGDGQREAGGNVHAVQPGAEAVALQPGLHQPPHQGGAGAGEGHLGHLLQTHAHHAGGRAAQPELDIAAPHHQEDGT